MVARESSVNPINAVNGRNRSEGRMVMPKIGQTKQTTFNGMTYDVTHRQKGWVRASDSEQSGHYMDFYYGPGQSNSNPGQAFRQAAEWMRSPARKAARARARRNSEENERIRRETEERVARDRERAARRAARRKSNG